MPSLRRARDDSQKNKRGRPRKTATKLIRPQITESGYVELVKTIRRSRNKDRVNEAYAEVERRLRPKLQQIVFRFNIPGMGKDDIYQEALFALRFKAIKDYDQDRGSGEGPYPFDKFAILCIRRHLATNLKASFQNKKRVLNQSLSLDQERRDSESDESIFLSDILSESSETILENVEDREYYQSLFSSLLSRLSDFEKQVFLYYVQKCSYEQITEKINAKRRIEGMTDVKVKSIDNALSRIKSKAKSIFEKFEE